jgi:hypothetical protein
MAGLDPAIHQTIDFRRQFHWIAASRADMTTKVAAKRQEMDLRTLLQSREMNGSTTG